MEARSLNTKLRNRTLWYDGDSSFSEKELLEQLLRMKGSVGVYAESITPAIREYNLFTSTDEQIGVKTSVAPLTYDWNLPDEYKTLDVKQHVNAILVRECANLSDDVEILKRVKRTNRELKLYEKAGLFDFLRALIFIINTLENHNVVWGVGRGSSVSSYVLYLIRVHDVDSVLYNLDIEDFLHVSGEA